MHWKHQSQSYAFALIASASYNQGKHWPPPEHLNGSQSQQQPLRHFKSQNDDASATLLALWLMSNHKDHHNGKCKTAPTSFRK